MKQIITTRLMHWKKQWVSLMFWLLFPFVATVSVIMITDALQDDAQIPVGVVLKEETDASEALVQKIKSAPFIRTTILPEDKALYRLEKHDLDSVFTIHSNFEQKIQQNNRSRLITAYQSDLSLAYSPVKEMIVSYVQQETGRAKAAFTIQELEKRYSGQTQSTIEDIVAKSKTIQKEEDLLSTNLTFHGDHETMNDTQRPFNVWGLWGIFSLLSAMLLFDWVIKEKQSKAIWRLTFSRWSLKSYLLLNSLLYTLVLFMTDMLTAVSLYYIFGEWLNPANLLVYRLLICTAAFLLAHLFKRPFYYNTVAFALVLLAGIGTGALLPTRITADWLPDFASPLSPLLAGNLLSLWPLAIGVTFVLWLMRKEQYHA
ncbi:hypothetical protein GCM10008983_13650 [Lentibacillus halophilus]|uniref:ABC-2 type transporter transmembrane domain-containing protein n=1 Tax=Lentibacillus halophilus TaxID=295065 RepID=A0ABP3J249_9BACI